MQVQDLFAQFALQLFDLGIDLSGLLLGGLCVVAHFATQFLRCGHAVAVFRFDPVCERSCFLFHKLFERQQSLADVFFEFGGLLHQAFFESREPPIVVAHLSAEQEVADLVDVARVLFGLSVLGVFFGMFFGIHGAEAITAGARLGVSGLVHNRRVKYNPALDAIRAVAVIAVVAFHSGVPLATGGFIGVDIFFVLSGYLITTLVRAEIRQTGTLALGRFYWRRALRLWPPLLLMLGAYAVIVPAVFPDTPVVRDVLITGVYFSDYSRALWGWPDLLNHTWSLSVEMHFYLIWPLVILAAARWTDRRVAALFALLFVLATAWRVLDLWAYRDWAHTYYRFDTRLSGLFAGGFIAVVPWRLGSAMSHTVTALAVLVLGACVAMLRWRMFDALTWVGIIVDFASAGLVGSIASGASAHVARALSTRPLVYVGLISYAVYLWHYPIARLVREHFDPGVTFLIVASLSIAMAALSYEFLEKPLRARRLRYGEGPRR